MWHIIHLATSLQPKSGSIPIFDFFLIFSKPMTIARSRVNYRVKLKLTIIITTTMHYIAIVLVDFVKSKLPKSNPLHILYM